ncbi:hypothetical protein [Phaeodactylibacter xiamenensis]|uniref:hypothetical protein n=1 Tax=Phaeodactylibacter xiamenensis TaxID=1524460 RepID=UPI003BACEC2B
MKNSNSWAIAFFILLIINVVGLVYLSSRKASADIRLLKEENHKLRIDFVENAEELKYLLDLLLESSDELKDYMPEYKDISDEEFEEALRKKVVKLNLRIEEVERRSLGYE